MEVDFDFRTGLILCRRRFKGEFVPLYEIIDFKRNSRALSEVRDYYDKINCFF